MECPVEFLDMENINFSKVKGVRFDPTAYIENQLEIVEKGDENFYTVFLVMTNNQKQVCAFTPQEESAIHVTYAFAGLFLVDVLNKLEL